MKINLCKALVPGVNKTYTLWYPSLHFAILALDPFQLYRKGD